MFRRIDQHLIYTWYSICHLCFLCVSSHLGDGKTRMLNLNPVILNEIKHDTIMLN